MRWVRCRLESSLKFRGGEGKGGREPLLSSVLVGGDGAIWFLIERLQLDLMYLLASLLDYLISSSPRQTDNESTGGGAVDTANITGCGNAISKSRKGFPRRQLSPATLIHRI